jgi:hypothetical protein
MSGARRSDFDVSNTVQVSSPGAVLAPWTALYKETWPQTSLQPLQHAFDHFEELFAGMVPGYFGVDTVYHDRQHTLDITLALARLIVGYERQQQPRRAWAGNARWWASSPASSTTSAICGARMRRIAQRRRVHTHARLARRAFPRALPADRRP